MKNVIFTLLFMPFIALGQIYQEPQPIISLLHVELKMDTLFIYRHVKLPPNSMSMNGEWYEYNDREVYVAGRGKEIILVATERAKIRKIKIDAEEEYW